MMMIKCLILVVMCLVVASADENEKKDHNHEAHKALCDLLNAAARKWGTSGETLSEPLRKALGRTIFGNDEGKGSLESLKSGLPKGYNDVEDTPDSRGNWCGQPLNGGGWMGENQARWSGHSAPHDMVCLCTLGNNTWPLNDKQKETTLCGKDGNALGGSDGKGWSNGGSGNEHVKATWMKVTVPCLNGEEGEYLKQALNEFLGKLQHKPDVAANPSRYILGENNVTKDDYTACTGSPKYGVCVAYFNGTTTKYPMPWWVDLQKAIPEDEKFQEEKKKREEEEKRKQKEREQGTDEPQAESLKSGQPITNQTEASNKDNITDKLRKLNLTGSSSISQPSSWLLSVAFLI